MNFLSKFFKKKPVSIKGKDVMQFAIVNESTDQSITHEILNQIASAVERQLFEHYAPFWEATGAVVKVYDNLRSAPSGSVIIAIMDNADQAGVLGYHAVTPDGRPYARIFWFPIKHSGGTLISGDNSLAVTISHEALEAMLDPYASFWAVNPQNNQLYALEACDAVEAQSYTIDGVSVSNFVGPRFFRDGPGPYDWMSQMLGGEPNVSKPFETTKNGYQIVATDMNNISQEYGEKYEGWKKESKSRLGSRTKKRVG